MDNTMINNLKEKTGQSLPQWLRIVRTSGLTRHGEIVKFLKTEHDFTHGYANLVAHKFNKSDAASASPGEDLIAPQYANGKEALRPIFDKALAAIEAFGPDVEIAPKRGYVSLRRKKQFAMLQPSTRTRFDVGFNLRGKKPAGRLESAPGSMGMCSHRVAVTSPKEIDREVIGWLREAYNAAN